jgi:hypothetical protein
MNFDEESKWLDSLPISNKTTPVISETLPTSNPAPYIDRYDEEMKWLDSLSAPSSAVADTSPGIAGVRPPVIPPSQGLTAAAQDYQAPQEPGVDFGPTAIEENPPQGLTTSIPRLMVEQAPEVLNDTKNRFIMGEQSARAGAAGTLANVARSIENAPLSEQSESMPMNYQGYQPKPTGEQRNMPSDWLRGAQDYWNGMASETEKKLLPEFQNSDSIIMQSLLSVPESVPSMIEMYLGGKVTAKGLEPLQINNRVAAAISSNPALKRNLPTIIKQVEEGGVENLAGAVSEGVQAGDAQANALRKQEVELQTMSLKDIKAKYANDPLFESVASRTKDPAEFEKLFKTEKSAWLQDNQAQVWADSAIQTAAVAALISGDLGEEFLKKSRVYAAKSLVAAPGNRFVDGVKAVARGANKLAPEAIQEFLQSGIDQANTMIQQPGLAGKDPNAPAKEGIKGALAALVMSGGSEAIGRGSAMIQQRSDEKARQAQQQQAAEADVNSWGESIEEQLAWLDNLGKLSEKGGITAEASKTAPALQEAPTPPPAPVGASEPVIEANQPKPGPGITQKAAEAEVTGKSPEAAKVEQEAIQAATSPENDLPEPTEAQKEAGNYKMGHVKLAGLDISIENPAGSTRSGIDADGEEWFNDMASHYGYIKGTVGKDKDHIDVFLNPDNPTSETVFIVNQQNPETKEFDEHKVMMGYLDEQDARDAYLENYDASGPDRIASIVPLPMEEFKKWAYSGEAKKGPVEEVAPVEDFKEVSTNGKVEGKGQEGQGRQEELLTTPVPETAAGQQTAQTQPPAPILQQPEADTAPQEQTPGTAPAPEKAMTAEPPQKETIQPKKPETDTSIKNAGVISEKQKREEKLVKAGLKKKVEPTPVEKPSPKVEEPAKVEPAVSEKPVFHDEYTGPRFTYGLQYRPMQIGAQPKGYIIGSDGKHPDFERFGTIQYPRELTAEEMKSYEMKPVTEAKKPAEKAKAEIKVESTPEGDTISVPSKDKPSISPKEQKKYLLAEIDKAVEGAEESINMSPVVEANADRELISKYYKNIVPRADLEPLLNKYGITNEGNESDIGNLMDAVLSVEAEQTRAAIPHVTIEVPGDGIFRIYNTKAALATFRDMAKKFPTAPVSATTKGNMPTGQSAIAKVPAKKPTDIKELQKIVEPFKGTDETKPIRMDSHIDAKSKTLNATDGRRVIRIEGVEGKTTEHADGEYPDVERVIPEYPEKDHVVVQDTELMIRQLRQIQKALTPEDRSAPVVDIFVKDGQIILASRNAELGVYQTGELKDAKLLSSVNAKYLDEALTAIRQMGNEKAKIYFDGKDSRSVSIVIKGEGVQVVQMPMVMNGRDVQKEYGLKPETAAKPKAKKEKAKKSGKVAEYRGEDDIEGDGFDIFEMDEGDLSDYFDEVFGDQPGGGGDLLSARRGGDYVFPTYEAFRDWMDARYAERDLEGMRIAFAENPTANKVKYVKDNMQATPHKKAWVFNIGTGSALPAEDGPVTRTTPRPTPSGRPAPGTPPTPGATTKPGQKPPKARPAPPTPPPRAATPYIKFDTMALVQLLRQFIRVPSMNQRLTRALGRMHTGTGAIDLKDKLFWDTALAEKVLGHEVGHFVDLLIELKGKGNPFGQRMAPLRDFKNMVGAKKALRNEARSLSRAWRGNFQNGDSYRDSAAELFADVMSMMFNKPEQVNQDYPLLHDAFNELMQGKPDFKAAYEEITNWLQGKTMTSEWRAQQDAAVEQTVQDLMKNEKKPTTPLWDVLRRSLVSNWYRAEDIIRHSGGHGLQNLNNLDMLEYSQSFAAKEDEIFRDSFIKKVQPFLKMVHPDMITARKFMHQYVQARRTIGERRAAGKWIEDNPTEAREMLKNIVDMDPSLSHRYASQIRNAADGELYNLAAVMFREIYDRGAPFAEKMADAITKMNLGVKGEAALMAFNVRGKLLNPGGLTVEAAQDVLKQLEEELGLERYNDLETAARNLRDLFHQVQKKAYDEGLISKKTWDELIMPNLDNYMPYAVLDYWEGKVNAGISGQKGTAKDIADVTLVSQMKVAALNAWRQKQRSVQLLKDIHEADGQAIPVDHKLERASDILAIRSRNAGDNVSRAVYYQNGSPYMVEFPNDIDKSLEKALDSHSLQQQLEWVLGASKLTHEIMQLYTTLNPNFLLLRNPARGARTLAEISGVKNTVKELTLEGKRAARIAKNYADAAFGAPLLPETKWFIDHQGLQPPRLSSIMATNLENVEEQLRSGAILGSQIKQMHAKESKTMFGGKSEHRIRKTAEKAFAGYEAYEKIINFYAAKANGLSTEESLALMRRGGIPKPGVGGQFSGVMELAMPWTRVHIQGLRATLDKLRDPKIGKAFAIRLVAYELAPRLFKLAAGIGVISAMLSAMGFGGDDDDPVMAEVYKRVSPYKMALDDMIPFTLFDPRTGTYHSFDEYTKGSQIPKHFEVVSVRIPSSEEGRLWGPLLYNVMSTIPGAREELAKPGETMSSSFGNWFINSMLPGATPLYKIPANLFDLIINGKNPTDDYRGQPVANPLLFKAGGWARTQAIAGYLMNQGGFVGEIAGEIATNLGMDKRATMAGSRREATDVMPFAQNIPVVKGMLSYDNYAEYRDKKNEQLKEEGIRSNAKMLLSPEAQSLYDFYYQNTKQKDKLSGEDKAKYAVASKFVNQVWGDMKKDNSFYAKASHAVGPDGTSAEREAVKTQLNAAAQPYVNAFSKGKAVTPQSQGARYNQQMGGRGQGYSGPKVGR